MSELSTHESISQHFPELRALLPRLRADDYETRRIALIELADEEEENYLPLLVEAIHDKDATVRTEAARLLEGWENIDVINALLLLLLDSVNEVREAAAQTLAQIKTREAGLQLLTWADHDDTVVQAAVLRALRELRLPEAAVPALRAINHVEASVRREAVGIFGWLKYNAALSQLAIAAMSDADAEVRRASVGALGMANDDSPLTALLHALQDTSWNVREEAAATLGKLKLAAAVPQLIAALHDEYWQVRLGATRALGRIGNVNAVTALIETLQHAFSNVRKEAAIALGEIGDVTAIESLNIAGTDTDPDVRKMARLALEKIQAKETSS